MSGPGATDPWMAAVAWLARHHGRPFSAEAIRAALPADSDLARPEPMARALSAAGLKSRRVSLPLKSLDPMVLPVLAVGAAGTPLLVTALDPRRKVARVVDPLTPDHETEVPLRRLARETGGEVLLVAPAGDSATGRLDPVTAARSRRAEHWFRGPVLRNWPAGLQVMIAALCLNLLSLALPLFVMNVYDRVIPNLAFVTLWTLATGVGIALALDFALRMLRVAVLDTVSARVELASGRRLFAQAMDVQLLARPGGAAGIASTIRDFDTVRDFFASASFVALIDLAFIGIFVAVLWWIVGPIALVPLVAASAVILLGLATQWPMAARIDRLQGLAAKRHTVLVETLSGIETVKSVGAEPVMQREWEEAVAAATRVGGETRFWSNLTLNGTLLVQQACGVVIIAWGVYLVAEGRITVGALIAANILSGRVLAPLASISQTLMRAQQAVRVLRGLGEFMRLPVERGETVSRGGQVGSGAVRFDRVGFRYPGGTVPALDNVSCEIAPGEIVGLLGRVGSGKSTFGRLMAGLIAAEAGTVLIDGREVRQYDPADLRRGVGYLPQAPDVFTGTLRENLSLGAPGVEDAALRAALADVGLGGFVTAAPEGLDLHLGERVQRLSGGQRQALALARLLVRRPKLLFLDEPTNMMDQGMEAAVAATLTRLAGDGVTVVLSTHRTTLAALAGRLIVLEAGRKMLDGPRDEVLARLSAAATRRGGAG
jgi:ATP-binding cassette subfamily C protein LapB